MGPCLCLPAGSGALTAAVSRSLIDSNENRDGTDGPWSTFNLGIGYPFQALRCIPDLSSSFVTVVEADGDCIDNSTNSCQLYPSYKRESSQNWREVGTYNLLWSEETSLMIANATFVKALWGSEFVSLGHNAPAQDPSFEQLVSIIQSPTSSKAVYGCTFGLGLNGTGPDGQVMPTLLSKLCVNRAIPSCSYSYMAGSAKS